MTDLLMFSRGPETSDQATFRHPASGWDVVLHDGGADAPKKERHHHYGVRVIKNDEVKAAYEYLKAHEDEYGLSDFEPPEYSHGSMSVYFYEPGGNAWEIECFEDVLRIPEKHGGERLGGVRAPHWSSPIPPDRFPGRGYVPQGFTHGTLACADDQVSGQFYRDVLGLQVEQAYKNVIYVKQADTPHFIVSLGRPAVGLNRFSPNFRYTLTLESTQAVEEAHAELAREHNELGIMEVRPVEETLEGGAAFLLRDLDGNWWEVASPEAEV
jgi:catechol 2,3-dioxygenase-like lactoylglutathione lyase family enzyme